MTFRYLLEKSQMKLLFDLPVPCSRPSKVLKICTKPSQWSSKMKISLHLSKVVTMKSVGMKWLEILHAIRIHNLEIFHRVLFHIFPWTEILVTKYLFYKSTLKIQKWYFQDLLYLKSWLFCKISFITLLSYGATAIVETAKFEWVRGP